MNAHATAARHVVAIKLRRCATGLLCSVLAIPAWYTPAIATDNTISALRLRVKDSRSLQNGVARIGRSLSLDSSDPALVPPSAGSAGDPSLHGAVLFVLNAAGSGESARIDLPATGWQADGSGWRYLAKTRIASAPVKVDVTWDTGRLRVRLRDKSGAVLTYSLDETTQGGLAVVLDAASGSERSCMEFAAGAVIDTDTGNSDADCTVRGSFAASDASAPLLCAVTAYAPAPADACDRWRLLDLLVEGQMQKHGIPALAAAIVRSAKPFSSKAWGERHVAPSRPALATTPFMLASISKTVTATAVLQLVDDGVFGLDDDIDSILDFSVDNPRVPGDEVITVRHLLTHTSGLIDDADVWGGYPGEANSLYVLGDSPIALGDFMRGYFTPGGAWYDAASNFAPGAPGTGYEYSNLASALLGHLIETATGTSLDDHSDARIFSPLGMGDTGWHLADFTVDDVAMPYESFRGEFLPWGHFGYPDYPNGQLRASVQDLARYLAAWAGGGTLDGVRILEEATVAEALSVQYPGVEATQGLSWYADRIGNRDVLGHNGGDYGVSTDMFFDPATGHGVIVLINTDETGARTSAMARIEEALFAIAEAP